MSIQSCVNNGGSIKTLNTKADELLWLAKTVVIVTHQYRETKCSDYGEGTMEALNWVLP